MGVPNENSWDNFRNQLIKNLEALDILGSPFTFNRKFHLIQFISTTPHQIQDNHLSSILRIFRNI